MKTELVNIKKLPKLLYKYRDTRNENHLKSLFDSIIYFASPNDFNDIYDCKIPIRYDLADDNHFREQLIAFLETEKKEYPQEHYDFYVEEFLSSGFIKDLRNNEPDEIYRFFLGVTKGVFCLSKKYNDLLMWGHYSCNHSGFCVGYKTSLLLDIGADYLGKINYLKDYPVILPRLIDYEDIINQLFTKSLIWNYEKEYRLVFRSITEKERIVQVDKQAIDVVYLGANMMKDIKIEFINQISLHLGHVKIYEAKTDDNSFKLNFTRVK